MRTHYFIALPVQLHLRRALEKVQREFNLDLFKHIVYPEDFHVTVEFLGGVSEEQLSSIHDGLQQLVKRIEPFELTVDQIGAFGRQQQPRVLYANVMRNERLDILHKEVHQICSATGLVTDHKEYRPHITLAKKWRFSEQVIPPAWPTLQRDSQEVSSLHLYKVAPLEKPRYQRVESYAFTKL
ncbi:MAG: RNA 2',3'-cyclic phosphodiesterase [Anaerobacillus sp.]